MCLGFRRIAIEWQVPHRNRTIPSHIDPELNLLDVLAPTFRPAIHRSRATTLIGLLCRLLGFFGFLARIERLALFGKLACVSTKELDIRHVIVNLPYVKFETLDRLG